LVYQRKEEIKKNEGPSLDPKIASKKAQMGHLRGLDWGL
jgi:hypothetical protein